MFAITPFFISSLMMSTVLTLRYSASSLTVSVGGSSTLPSAATGLASAAAPPGANWVRTDASCSGVSTAIACLGACRVGRRKCRSPHAERPMDRSSFRRRRPALGVVAEVGAPARHPAGITDELAVNDTEPDQLGLRLDLAAPDAASKRLSPVRHLPPIGFLPPLLLAGPAGGSRPPRLACYLCA